MIDLAKAKKKNRFKVLNGCIHKACTKCHNFKPLEMFSTAKNTVDKKTPNCKECRRKIPQDLIAKRRRYLEDGCFKKAVYYQNNKEKIHASRKVKLLSDPSIALKNRARRILRKHRLMCKTKRDNTSLEILGCSRDFLFNHLKATFTKNYGIEYNQIYFKDLQIDHIVPLATAKTYDKVKALCHYTNLQFLYCKHNYEKKAKLNYSIPKFPKHLYETQRDV